MQDVHFDDDEIKALRRLAFRRNDDKESRGIPTGRVDGDRTNEEIHEIGILGEAACAKILGDEVSVNREILPSGDDGFDIRIDGLTAEVKTREGREKDYAMYDNTSDIEADMAILCWKTSPRDVTVVGWMPRTEWILKAHEIRFGQWVRRGVEWDEMRPIEELRSLINEAP